MANRGRNDFLIKILVNEHTLKLGILFLINLHKLSEHLRPRSNTVWLIVKGNWWFSNLYNIFLCHQADSNLSKEQDSFAKRSTVVLVTSVSCEPSKKSKWFCLLDCWLFSWKFGCRRDFGITMLSQTISCLFTGFLKLGTLYLQMLRIKSVLVLLSLMIEERFSLYC